MFDGRFRTGVDRVVTPVGVALKRTGLSPDHLTGLGLAMALPTAWAIAAGRLRLGLLLLVASAVPDLLDGALAKASGRASLRGAFFDSVSDRVTDALVLGGVAWYLQNRYHGHAAMLPFAVLGASLLISYERAKAESLGFSAKGGLMERAERVIALCIGLAFSAVLVPVLWLMLALTLVTAGQRFVKVWRQASKPARPDTVAMADRWRAWREANGWAPHPSPFSAGNRRTEAGSRRRERRRARLRQDEGRDGAGGPPFRRRLGSRRP